MKISILKNSKKFCVAFYTLAVTAILLEVSVRFWGYSEHYISDPIYMPFQKTPEISFIHKPNLQDARARGLAIINTDSLGLRSVISGTRYGVKKNGEFRIVIMGDSVTFGEGVKRNEDVFSQRLECILNQKQNIFHVKLFNFAASAYSVKDMTETLKYRALELEPVLLLWPLFLLILICHEHLLWTNGGILPTRKCLASSQMIRS